MRTVLCHYHIYKNAGTSFDHVLTNSFGTRHLSFDGPFPFFTIDQEQLDRIIGRRAEAVAFSSHQIQLPPPKSGAYRVVSVVFLRHPLLRVASIWRFKSRAPDGTPTSEAARAMPFDRWVEHCLSDPDEIVHVSNAQARLLSCAPRERAAARRHPGRMDYDIARAEDNLAGATAAGLADRFSDDIARIAGICAGYGLDLAVPADLHLNATAPLALSPAARVAEVAGMLGPSLAERLTAANDQDLRLLALAERRAAPRPEAA
ncbi:MAG: hypothetical protein ACOY4T_06360 [Pseudomonadota bacterium]|jgi:hypothetical protein